MRRKYESIRALVEKRRPTAPKGKNPARHEDGEQRSVILTAPLHSNPSKKVPKYGVKNSMRPKPAQLSVIAVAALAIVAVAAAMLLAGGNPAQATTAETVALNHDGDGIHQRPAWQGGGATPTPTPTPVQPTPDPCAHVPDHVFDTGHIALFEVYWDAGTETLVNNPCPAKLKHIPPTPPATEETHERKRTGANIGSTIFHATSRYKGGIGRSRHPHQRGRGKVECG